MGGGAWKEEVGMEEVLQLVGCIFFVGWLCVEAKG